MLKARIHRHVLHFRLPAGTSRGILNNRETWYLHVWDDQSPDVTGIGECCMLPGLSADDRPEYPEMLEWVCRHISEPAELLHEKLADWPSIRFGLEMAMLDLNAGGYRLIFPTEFTRGIRPILINGLVWMGDKDFMLKQIGEKIDQGFRVIKMKVGAIDFADECELLGFIRSHYPEDLIEIRLDANGAFSKDEATSKLETLSAYGIHSIEQPLRTGQPESMERLCRLSPIPVALDEELIGIRDPFLKRELLTFIRPHFIILKPSLLGGFAASHEWIDAAEETGAGWWVTSALESNIGLNAIAQWTASLNTKLPQGLGTGSLYTNNVPSPLQVKGGYLHYIPEGTWDLAHTLSSFPGKKEWDLSLKVDGKILRRKQCLEQADFWMNVSDSELWMSDLGKFLVDWYADDPYISLTTSGSTGDPKEIRLLKSAMIASAKATGEFFGLNGHDKALLCLSVRYIAGMMMVVRAMVNGMNLETIKPDGNPLMHITDDRIPTFAAMVPAQVHNILKDNGTFETVKKIRTLIIGGGEIHPELERQIAALPNAVYTTYGMTETITHIALRRLTGPERQIYYTALPGVTLSTDDRGCLVIDAPRISPGPVITNDMVELKNNRQFRWLGRIDNMINRGGLKIIPEIIENKLGALISERFFVGALPDEKFGQVPVIIIESAGLTDEYLKKVQTYIDQNIDRHARPERIFTLAEFIETGSGKINRTATMSMVNNH
jgi:o-succinylbenzoate synthase